jgi:hypothetical protein
MVMPTTTTATVTAVTTQHVHARIMQAAARQIATSDLARAIEAAGLGDQLRDLIQQIAANVANPLACDVEDAIAFALAGAAR